MMKRNREQSRVKPAPKDKSCTRRAFLKGACAPLLLPASVWAAKPSEKPRMALIGCGRQGRGLLHGFLGQDLVVAAVCDCDKVRLADRQKVVADYYKSRPELGVAADACRATGDFREIIADKSIDMVCVATPDHWHAHIAIAAMKAGKDVYCEKPLTYNIEEARQMMQAARETGRIVQTGAMQRSGVEFRTACEIVRNGLIGRVTHVDANFGGPSRPHRDYENPANAAQEGAPNPDVDFNLWCGPAPLVKYSDRLSPRGVHTFYPMFWRHDDLFASGDCGDWGAHHLDIAQWGLGLDEGGPVRVVRSTAAPAKDPFCGGRRQRGVQLVCADGCVIRHNPFGSWWGTIFYGTEGIVAVNRGKFAVWLGKGVDPTDGKIQKGLMDATFDGLERVAFWGVAPWDKAQEPVPGSNRSMLDAVNKAIKRFSLKKAAVKLYKSQGHVGDFVKCCASRQTPCSGVEVGARASILCQLCNTSYIHDAGFEWDPVKNTFAAGTGDAAWLKRRPSRTDW